MAEGLLIFAAVISGRLGQTIARIPGGKGG
jgi:hypothetical protein